MSDERNTGAGSIPGGAGSGQRGAPSNADVRAAVLLVSGLSMAIGALGSAAVVSNGPQIKRWWHTQAVPAAEAVRRKVRRRGAASPDRTVRNDAPSDSVILTRSTLRDFTRRVDAAVASALDGAAPTGWVQGPAKQNLVDVFLAASIIADRMRTRSDDDHAAEAHLPELEAAIGRLATEQVVDALNRALSADATPLDGDTLVIVTRVFAGGHVEAGRYIPVTRERVVAALRLSRSVVPLPFDSSGPGAADRKHPLH